MPRTFSDDAAIRDRLLRRAADIVAAEGMSGLSVRRLASEVGASTAAIYSHFGSKSAVVSALYLRALSSLVRSRSAVQASADPAVDLLAICLSYWDWGVANPHFYRIVFGEALGSYSQELRQDEVIQQARQPLYDTIERCIERGDLIDRPDAVRAATCAALHGAIGLAHSGDLVGDQLAQRDFVREMFGRTFFAWSPGAGG